jgi:hypothetical protein
MEGVAAVGFLLFGFRYECAGVGAGRVSYLEAVSYYV